MGGEEQLPGLVESYRRAVEQALRRVPVRNGVVSLRDIWLETALPVDLIAELLRDNGVRMPEHVQRIDLSRWNHKIGGHGD